MTDKIDNIEDERMKNIEQTSIPDADIGKAKKKGSFFGDPFLVIE
jgi:hypothetical protein